MGITRLGIRWAALALSATALLSAADYKPYPFAKPAARPAEMETVTPDAPVFATHDEFARVAYHFRTLGTEQKLPQGPGDGTARASFVFNSGETINLYHPRPRGTPETEKTFIEVTRTAAVPPATPVKASKK